MNNKSVRKNALYNLIFQFFIYLIPLISTPYVSRVLGAEHVGQYSYALSIATYFWLTAVLGSSTHGQRVIAYTRDDKEKLSNQFWNIFFFRVITTIISLVIYFCLIVLLGNISVLQIIVSLYIINVSFDISWLFQGLEDFKKTVTRGLTVKVLGLVGVFIFVRTENDTWKYAFILLGSMLIGNLFLWLSVPKVISRPKIINPFKEFKDTLLVFLPTVASQVYMVLDKSMIGIITHSDYSNGCYEQAEKLVRVVVVIVSAVSTVVLPRVANLYSQNKLDKAKEYIYKAYRVVFLLAVPMFYGIIITASIFLPIYLGTGFDLAIVLMQIFSWLIIVVSLASITGLSYLVPTKQQNVYTISVTIAAIVNLIMNLFLIQRIGAVGAAIASISAETIGTAIQIGYCVYKKQLSLKRIFIPACKSFISGTIMFCILLFLKKWFDCGFVSLFVLVAIGSIVYCVILIVLKDRFVLDLINSTKKGINRNHNRIM